LSGQRAYPVPSTAAPLSLAPLLDPRSFPAVFLDTRQWLVRLSAMPHQVWDGQLMVSREEIMLIMATVI
jgi:hypothetical protein